MKEFVNRLTTDKAFAAEFKAYMATKNEKIKQGTKLIGENLNRLIMRSIQEFAASKGMTLTDDEQTAKSLSALSKQIVIQMNEMIVKNFAALEGSMKQPLDMPPEMIQVIRENKELFAECLHKADAPAAEAIRKFGQELNAVVMASFKEFSEKTGYHGPYPSTEINKAIIQKLNEVICTQQKALVELSKTAH